MASIPKEFEWQQKENTTVKETGITQTPPMVFAFMKEGSPFIKIVHSVGKFGGEKFSPAKYQDQSQVIGLLGDRVQGVNTVAIFVENHAWKWTKDKIVLDIIVSLAAFYSDLNKRRVKYTPVQGDQKVELDTPMLSMIPTGLGEWLMVTPRIPWELTGKFTR